MKTWRLKATSTRFLSGVVTACLLALSLMFASGAAAPAFAQGEDCDSGFHCGGTAVATSETLSTPNNQPLTATISSEANSPNGVSSIGGSVTTNPAHGSVSLGALVVGPGVGPLGLTSVQTFTYTPAAGFTGTDSFVYTATCDICNNDFPATITIDVTAPAAPPPPAAPTANGGALSTAYNTAVSGTLSGGGQITAYALSNGATYGSVAINGSTVTYTPNAGFIGGDSFGIIAEGPGGDSGQATWTVSVAAPPPPSAGDVSLSTSYQQSGSTALSSSGDVTGYALISGAANGSASIVGPNADYTPNAGFSGSDSFTYVAQGPGGNSNVATVYVTVGAAPPPPAPAGPTAPTANSTSFSTAYETAGSKKLTDSAGDTSGYALTSQPENGTASLSGRTVTYTPNLGFIGTDSFTFTASNAGGTSAPATVTVKVGDPPVPTAFSAQQSTPFNTPAYTEFNGNGDDPLYYTVTQQPAHGKISVSGLQPGGYIDGGWEAVTYTPNANYIGVDSFSFTETTPGGTSAPATITITVESPSPPVAYNTTLTTAYNTTGSTPFVATGADIESYTFKVKPSNGTATHDNGIVTYTPNPGFYGSDSLTYVATNPGGNSNQATVYITVQQPPAPTAYGASFSTGYETMGSTALTATGAGVTGYTLVSGAANGAVLISGSTAYYIPNQGFIGTDSFTFTATGAGGTSAPATVTVYVSPPPPPTVYTVAITSSFNTPGSVAVSSSEDDTSSFSLASTPANGTVTISGNVITYTPNPGFVGNDSFNYVGNDPGGTGAPATVYVTVQPPPPPTVYGASMSTAFNTPQTTGLPATGALISGYAIVNQPAHGSVTVSGNVATYTPAANYVGVDSFTFDAVNPGGTSNVATITVTVMPPPIPTASNGSISTAFQTTVSTPLAASGLDITSYQIAGQPAHGSVSIAGAVATYTPAANYYGTDSFTFTATNPGGTSSPATISVIVARPPPPVAQNGSVTTPYLAPIAIPLQATGALISSYAIVSQPGHGTLTLSGGTATYTPNNLFWGQDSFTFDAVNPGGTSNVATVSITVQLPPPPVVVSSNTTTPYQTATTITLTSTGVGSTFAIASQPSLGTVTLSGDVITYTPNWGTAGVDSFTVTVSGPGGTSQPTTIYVTNEPPPLPEGAGSYTGAAIPSSGASTAICPAVGAAAIPGLPGPPTGTAYDPNWCQEQALTIAQQLLQLQNQQQQIANLQQQTAVQQKLVQNLGSDSTSAQLASINAAAAKILSNATGIGFNQASTGAAFAAAYPPSATVAGFNNAQLSAALSTWQANTAAALNTAVQTQNAIAMARPTTTAAVQNAVNASNAAPGPTAAVQATNQLLAAVSTQLAQLQDILIGESQAQTAVDAAQSAASATGAAAATQTSGQVQTTVTAAPGVSNTNTL